MVRVLVAAFVALMLAMPSEADIARDIGRDVDPDAIFAARSRLRTTIGSRLGPALRETYRRMQDDGPYSPDAASGEKPSPTWNITLSAIIMPPIAPMNPITTARPAT